MKKVQLISILLVFILSLGWNIALDAQKNSSFFVMGPSLSQHYATSYTGFRQFHPGFGGEVKLSLNKWVLGLHGYYMIKDSMEYNAYWTGLTAGYRFGSKKKLWCHPFVIIGGIKKREYHSGKFGLFALPVLAIGYNGFGLNVGYIPKLPGVTNPILIFQVKVRIVSFQL